MSASHNHGPDEAGDTEPAQKRVLVVDHYVRDAEAVARVAHGRGYPTVLLNHANTFEIAYRSFRPSLIVLNLYMPQFDGIDAARWLAERDNAAPLILVSHHGSLFARAAKAVAERAGFPVCFFNKPLTDRMILEMLETEAAASPADAMVGLPPRQVAAG